MRISVSRATQLRPLNVGKFGQLQLDFKTLGVRIATVTWNKKIQESSHEYDSKVKTWKAGWKAEVNSIGRKFEGLQRALNESLSLFPVVDLIAEQRLLFFSENFDRKRSFRAVTD